MIKAEYALYNFQSITDDLLCTLSQKRETPYSSSCLGMLRYINFGFRLISIRFLAQNHDFDSIRF